MRYKTPTTFGQEYALNLCLGHKNTPIVGKGMGYKTTTTYQQEIWTESVFWS